MVHTQETLKELIARQLELENESRALGAARYQSSRPLPWRTETSSVIEEAELPPGRQLLKLALEPAAAAITEFLDRVREGGAGRRPKAYRVLCLAGAQEAAYLTGRVVVNAAASRLPVTTTAYAVAASIIEHIEMVQLKAANKAGFKGLVKAQKKGGSSSKKRQAIKEIMANEGARLEVPQAEQLQIGLKAIELFISSSDLFVMELGPNKSGRDTYFLRPTEALAGWLERQHARCELLEPIHLPMVVRPRAWRTPFWGGYLTKRPGLRLVKQWNDKYHTELRNVDMKPVYDAVNAVQNTAWRINETVLSVMREVWDGGGDMGGLPRRDDVPLPAKPEGMEEDPSLLKDWKREAAIVHQANAMALSKRLSFQQRLWIADKFEAEAAIYFPHELDFRGRIYPIPTGGPHPQADDSGKALLQFAEGKPLGDAGAWWLAVHIANLFGVDKVSFKDRVDWVFANTQLLLDSADDPLDGARFWTTADSPWCALAACVDWAGYMKDGGDYVSHTPIALDGSNSGLQHFSAMLRDPVGAAAVNLLPSDKPQDVYAQVAAKAQAMADTSTSEELRAWAGGKVSRKIAKRPCMTYVYSATRFGMHDMILQTLREVDKEHAKKAELPHLAGADNYKSAMALSYVMWDAIQQTVVAASGAMEWLRNAAKIATTSGQPIWWTTPMGLPVLQMYRATASETVNVFIGAKRLQLVTAVHAEGINRNAQVNGIAPNFVHSMDAAHLMAVANTCVRAGIISLAVIHDSFGTHAADAADLAMILKETFVAQYTPNVLARFRDELMAQLPPEIAELIPELPPLGTLDLSEVLRSDYVFA
ncbi:MULTISPECIES: DNA-directed RNA polymerase [unclassified Caulobacter]|uniref:DNA-directed RNA polymerase n=1 Tax=unclassified Caulobacter TaxID=2648921 RepID=UPI001304A2EC|nr:MULTISPECIES: DNA-directed RNA polymerase [unclassified Caulobacter]